MPFELPSNFGHLLNKITDEHMAARFAEKPVEQTRHEMQALAYACEMLQTTNLREMRRQFEEALEFNDRATVESKIDWYGEHFSTDRRLEEFLQNTENVIFGKHGVNETGQKEMGNLLHKARYLIKEYAHNAKPGELTDTLIQLETLVCVNASQGESDLTSYGRRKTTYKVFGWSFIVANVAAIPFGWVEPISIKASIKGGDTIIKASDKLL